MDGTYRKHVIFLFISLPPVFLVCKVVAHRFIEIKVSIKTQQQQEAIKRLFNFWCESLTHRIFYIYNLKI